MSEKVKALKYVCACGEIELIEDIPTVEEPMGFHGTVRALGLHGSSGNVGWWACRSDHIVASINKAIQQGH